MNLGTRLVWCRHCDGKPSCAFYLAPDCLAAVTSSTALTARTG
jgi:hypothetical protein